MGGGGGSGSGEACASRALSAQAARGSARQLRPQGSRRRSPSASASGNSGAPRLTDARPSLCGVASRGNGTSPGSPDRVLTRSCGTQCDGLDVEACWTLKDAERLYNVPGWGAPHFGVGREGTIEAQLGDGQAAPRVCLQALVEEAAAADKGGARVPVVAHFPSMAADRYTALAQAFERATSTYGYSGRYRGVFPIKANHAPPLLRMLARSMAGLEVGSKPELLVAMAVLAEAAPERVERGERPLLVCNGYKDRAYVEAALLARRLGLEVLIVLERPEELDLVLDVAESMGAHEQAALGIGVRARLSTAAGGHWARTGGDGGKFGMGAQELVGVVEQLRRRGSLPALRMLHFHVGSQVSRISTIKAAMREASHLYTELRAMGAQELAYVDVGGGLAVDYDGSGRAESGRSLDYSVQNYANDVVAAIRDACVRTGASDPHIISESGRAIASHHSVLIFDVAAIATPGGGQCGDADGADSCQPEGGAISQPGVQLLGTFDEVLQALANGKAGAQETRTDAAQLLAETRSAFKLGVLSLPELAQAEALYWRCVRAAEAADSAETTAGAASGSSILAARYTVNMSVFRSCVDAWAIDQVFPVMPLHLLDKKPANVGTLGDITCDSDGLLTRFVGPDGMLTSQLPLHSAEQIGGRQYLLGLFMAGVYQEDMGSLHNMFGATAQVYVVPDETRAQGWRLERAEPAQTSGASLRALGHCPEQALAAVQRALESDDAHSTEEGKQADTASRQQLIERFTELLGESTYLTSELETSGL